MTQDLSDEEFFRGVTEASGTSEALPAPSALKAKIYSALVCRQAETGPLMSLTEVKVCGQKLCIFEELVRIAPVAVFVSQPNSL